MLTRILNFLRQEEGQGVVEYGLILALISIVAIGAMTAVGTSVQAVFSNVAANL
jgi:pilus assembly protein Flp/PilA